MKWTDEMVLRYAQLYRWSSTRISIEGFKNAPDWQDVKINDDGVNKLPESESSSPSPLKDGWVEMVLEWHKKFGVDIGETPKFLQPARFEMRQNILREEVDELYEAFFEQKKQLWDVADAICDIMYVAIGTAIEFGLHEKLNELFSEVHRSNMSKLDENGNPVKREDGKILKSKLFSPPDLKSIITKK